MVLIFGVKFESNSLLANVLELFTIKIQTGAYFNEVLMELIKVLKELIKAVNYLVGAVHRPVTYSNLMFLSGVCAGFDSFCYFQTILKNKYLHWTHLVTAFEIYIYLH